MADITSILCADQGRTGLAKLDWNDYKAFPGLNPSTIVHGIKSMKHLKWAWDHGRDDSDAMQWGRLLHCLMFEPQEVEKRYRSWKGRRAGNEYKEFEAQAFLDGAEVLPYEGRYSMSSALEAAKSFLADDLTQSLIKSGQAEMSVFAVEHGLQCRGRLDWISGSGGCIVDLKTARNILARAFGRDFYAFQYDVKLGLYRRWLRKATQKDWPVQVIALESSPPFDVAVVPIPEAVLDRGERLGLGIIRSVRECIDSGEWPGVSCGEPYYLDTPTWEMDDELEGAEEVEYGE